MKKLLIFIICFILILPLFTNIASAADNRNAFNIEPPEYETDIALLVNVDTDTVVYSKNADKFTAPASLTKIVTALVVLEKGDALSTQITCQKEAIDSILGTGSSVAGLYAGEKTTLEMLLYCLFLPSANDAAAVFAYHYGNGNPQVFVDEMNAYVEKLGCKNSYFANPHGLDDESTSGFSSNKQSRTTANDMYIISKHALENETIRKISSKYGKTMPKTNKSDVRYLYNTNPLLNEYSFYHFSGPQIIGLKTGTTDKAGACLVTSAKKDGYTYIAIAMNGVTDYYLEGEGRNTAFLTCGYMLRWAFNNMEMKVLADTERILGEVSVEYGRSYDYVSLVPEAPVKAVVLNEVTVDDFTVNFSEAFPEKVKAPIEEGEEVGKAYLLYNDVVITEVTLVAGHTVKKNYIWAMFNWVLKLVKSPAFYVSLIVLALLLCIFFSTTKKQRKQKKRQKNTIHIVSDYSKLGK
ncbi:MAG: D-alanyl-D-alanine carboxypeptidase [Clostridia bacterium]|nr:D-alanyl-D-alanine carboxypeptidase [Clostridia bacterium]